MALDKKWMVDTFNEIKANHTRLDGCAKHDFVQQDKPGYEGTTNAFQKRWFCLHCHGHIDNVAYLWYSRGVAHGKSI